MPITRLELADFRNYPNLVFEPSDRLTVLVGPNGAGKTSIIEAIQMLTATVSFRTSKWTDLVLWGTDSARASVESDDDGRRTEIELEVTTSGRRRYTLNGTRKRTVSEVTGTLPSVTFTPDDLDLVKGPSERRRSALDDLGGQLSRAYSAVRADYSRVVRHRNALLKNLEESPLEMEPWDEQLVAIGSRLASHRIRLFARLSRGADEIHQGLTDREPLDMEYRAAWLTRTGKRPEDVAQQDIASALRDELESRRAEERARRTTLTGPHRDDVAFVLAGKEARSFASQGQQRTIALAVKLAEVRVIEEVKRREPILLLDDVMSELDEARRRALMSVVDKNVQTVITSTNAGQFQTVTAVAPKVVTLG